MYVHVRFCGDDRDCKQREKEQSNCNDSNKLAEPYSHKMNDLIEKKINRIKRS